MSKTPTPNEIATALQRLELSQEAMEARLMARLNALQENMIERFRAVDITLAAHTELTRSTNTLLQMLVNNSIDHGKRITRCRNT
jgi:hypothetical protein